jgi:hypothetical protein
VFDLALVAGFNARVNRRILRSGIARCLLFLFLAAAPALRLAVAATPQRGTTDEPRVIEICSDDAPETSAAFLRATAQVLSEDKIRLRFTCSRDRPTDVETPAASFVADEGGISLRLFSATHGQNVHGIAWLDDVHRPLEKTIALGKASTLGLLLDSLAADLQALHLRPLPVLPPPERPVPTSPAPQKVENVDSATQPRVSVMTAPVTSPTAEPSLSTITPPVARAAPPPAEPPAIPSAGMPAASASPRPPADESPAKKAGGPAGEAKPAVSQPPPAAAEPPAMVRGQAGRQRGLEIALPLAGIDWMPPSTVAPQLEAGVAWGGPRWWMLAQGILQLDSNFAMDWRTFHTAGYGLRIGGRRILLRSERFRWDAEAGLVGHLSQYQRDGVANAQTHAWLDLGAGLHSRVVLRIARHVSALVSLGGQVFPTARTATIPNGPTRRINLVTLSAVAGLCVDF